MAVLPSEARRLAICEWLTANGINPNIVPLHAGLETATRPDGTRVIRFEAYIRDEAGRLLADGDEPAREDREVPLLVEPPENWPA